MLFEGPVDGLDKANLPAELVKKAKDLASQPNEVRIQLGANGNKAVGGSAKAFTLDRADKEHEITLKADATGRHLTVKDLQTGVTIYDGPADTDDQLKGLPVPVLEKVKAALKTIN